MSKLLTHDWSDESVNWLETDHIQVAICSKLRHRDDYNKSFLFSSRVNEGKRGPSTGRMLKLAGMMPGEPDMTFFLPGGKVFHLELKAKKGRLSKSQRDRHNDLKLMGHRVYTVIAKSPQDGIDQVMAILDSHI